MRSRLHICHQLGVSQLLCIACSMAERNNVYPVRNCSLCWWPTVAAAAPPHVAQRPVHHSERENVNAFLANEAHLQGSAQRGDGHRVQPRRHRRTRRYFWSTHIENDHHNESLSLLGFSEHGDAVTARRTESAVDYVRLATAIVSGLLSNDLSRLLCRPARLGRNCTCLSSQRGRTINTARA